MSSDRHDRGLAGVLGARGYEPERGSQGAMTSRIVSIGQRRIRLAGLDRVVFPAGQFTRGDVVDYYLKIAPQLLASIGGRPITLRRYPDGVGGAAFDEADSPRFRPEWMRTALQWSATLGRNVAHTVIDDVASLVWLVNLGLVEIPTGLSRVPDVDVPTEFVLVLEPDVGASVADCCRVAVVIHDMLAELGLAAWAMTSGTAGITVRVPLAPPASFATTCEFARTLARTLERAMPGQVVAEQTRSGRHGIVHVDWSQNREDGRCLAPWSLRATPTPTVAMPVDWGQVRSAGRHRDAQALYVSPSDAVELCEAVGRELRDVLAIKQTLPAALLI